MCHDCNAEDFKALYVQMPCSQTHPGCMRCPPLMSVASTTSGMATSPTPLKWVLPVFCRWLFIHCLCKLRQPRPSVASGLYFTLSHKSADLLFWSDKQECCVFKVTQKSADLLDLKCCTWVLIYLNWPTKLLTCLFKIPHKSAGLFRVTRKSADLINVTHKTADLCMVTADLFIMSDP